MRNWLGSGDWNAICDSCGRKFKASTMKKRWDGMIVCPEDWETKHPQLSLRIRQEKIAVPWVRHEPTDLFINNCNLVNSLGRAGISVAGCAVSGGVTNASLI